MATAILTDTTADVLAELYGQDFQAWCLRTAELLGNRRLDALDIDHLREEVEGLALRDQREVVSRIKRIQQHLLKLEFQPQMKTKSWTNTSINQRDELASIFDQSPSLIGFAQSNTDKAYTRARRAAALETDLPMSAFPDECPYTFDQILDLDFVPVK